MTLIEINKKYYTVPTEWNELSRTQLLQVMDVFFVKQYGVEQAELKLLKILCNMNYWQFFQAKPVEMQEFLYLSNFLLQKDALLTKQLIPCYDNLHGPADGFSNLLMKEFVFSEGLYMQWSDDKTNEELLNQFIATIYRKPKPGYNLTVNPDGDPRTDFNENICAIHAKKIISRWPVTVKLAIATWYGGCRQHLVKQFSDVFSGGGDPAQYGLVSMMMSVAKRGVLGDFNKVENQFVTLVLMDINESIAEAREQERAMQKK